jgi:hypothetical protein
MKGRWRDLKLARSGYSDDGLKVIRLYNSLCVPHGFLPVDRYSQELDDALELFVAGGLDDDELNYIHAIFDEAIDLRRGGDHSYNTPRGAKLIRILWSNY